ncbi:MAG: thiamine pyrophosphate-binding protein [Deltaproteobacteria bacterium]|nr:thiamine pyrophosphate-binding protein [Deltaproteobacteria bacterium]MBI3079404.1 thiamine pyrophosphate-binding protein [Deltaproteobacteria bacterium]
MEGACGQAIVQGLRAEGVELVFGMLGNHLLSVYEVLGQDGGIRHITVNHENHASLMALTYAQLTGRPGVCLTTAGPGAVNALSGVAQAYDLATPLVHISGTVPLNSGRETFHGVDRPDFLCKMFQDVTKWSVRVERLSEFPDILSRAFALARGGRPGPVHIEIPQDVVDRPEALGPYRRETLPVPPVDGAGLRAAQALLADGRAPVICAGRGSVASGAASLVVQWAEHLGAPVVFPRDAIGVIPADHPLWGGMIIDGYFRRWFGNPAVDRLLQEADPLIVVGVRRRTPIWNYLQEFKPARWVHVAYDEGDAPAVPGVTLTGEIRGLVEALLERTAGGRPHPGLRTVAEARARLRAGLDAFAAAQRDAVPVHFGYAMRELAPLLDREAIIVSGAGNSGVWARSYLPALGPSHFFETGQWNAMGNELPMAIGAKLACPGRQVVSVAGDGSFLMACGEFGTAVQENAPIVVVILNDGLHGMIAQMQEERYHTSRWTQIARCDFAALAESFGGVGIRVERPGELREAFAKALGAGRPVIVDVLSAPYPYPSFPELMQQPS